MRAYGSVILALAVVVLSWDAARQAPAPAGEITPRKPDAASPVTAPASAALVYPEAHSQPQPQPAVAPIPAPARTDIAEPLRAPGGHPAHANPEVPQHAVAASMPGVQELAPGSKALSEAIASNVASEAFQDVASPLARLYLAYFDRPPDYEGFDYYLGERERGEPLDAIAEEFAGSLEFDQRYGALDNATFVDRVFQNVFGVAVIDGLLAGGGKR